MGNGCRTVDTTVLDLLIEDYNLEPQELRREKLACILDAFMESMQWTRAMFLITMALILSMTKKQMRCAHRWFKPSRPGVSYDDLCIAMLDSKDVQGGSGRQKRRKKRKAPEHDENVLLALLDLGSSGNASKKRCCTNEGHGLSAVGDATVCKQNDGGMGEPLAKDAGLDWEKPGEEWGMGWLPEDEWGGWEGWEEEKLPEEKGAEENWDGWEEHEENREESKGPEAEVDPELEICSAGNTGGPSAGAGKNSGGATTLVLGDATPMEDVVPTPTSPQPLGSPAKSEGGAPPSPANSDKSTTVICPGPPIDVVPESPKTYFPVPPVVQPLPFDDEDSDNVHGGSVYGPGGSPSPFISSEDDMESDAPKSPKKKDPPKPTLSIKDALQKEKKLPPPPPESSSSGSSSDSDNSSSSNSSSYSNSSSSSGSGDDEAEKKSRQSYGGGWKCTEGVPPGCKTTYRANPGKKWIGIIYKGGEGHELSNSAVKWCEKVADGKKNCIHKDPQCTARLTLLKRSERRKRKIDKRVLAGKVPWKPKKKKVKLHPDGDENASDGDESAPPMENAGDENASDGDENACDGGEVAS